MAENGQRTHRIGRERIKYLTDGQPDQNKIRSICRAISTECNYTRVDFNVRDNGTTEFFVRGADDKMELALRLIHLRLKGRDGEQPPPEVVPLTVENIRRHNKNLTERRQFVCGACRKIWFRKVFSCKPVSRCAKCHVRYDPIPRGSEFGHGFYRCRDCGNEFTGRATAGVPAPCFVCGRMCMPLRIGPKPERDLPRGGGRHACEMCDNGRIQPCPSFNQFPVVSQRHESTGSTVSTFLTQTSDISIDLEND
ncbi:shiftless antiviral inhibitor of ribosomal frameshifting protein homolog [Lytechinus variegatus]|uniref:shiftless antiviral inhibitor of ribosomal frameshifting protein homolog n=1 Tax=Lytechinus variegatus TaxID=7654 RepID=UPI001BB172EF|nr:shiftless antiviral inhibitor of ribosomal frameshifting protein homolog [Lytechinus variegatus]